MSYMETLAAVRELGNCERLKLVQEVWTELEGQDAWPDLSEATTHEFDRRIAEFVADPSIGVTWEEAKQEALAGLQS